jgi:hypothetical protein
VSPLTSATCTTVFVLALGCGWGSSHHDRHAETLSSLRAGLDHYKRHSGPSGRISDLNTAVTLVETAMSVPGFVIPPTPYSAELWTSTKYPYFLYVCWIDGATAQSVWTPLAHFKCSSFTPLKGTQSTPPKEFTFSTPPSKRAPIIWAFGVQIM